MVAGATGIDLFLLVIDAGEGARPQTHEHLAILRLLGVERGVVAVTKADAVDEETLALARRGGARARPRRARSSPSARRRAPGSTSCAPRSRRRPTPSSPEPTSRPDAALRRPRLHPARDRHGRDRHALVGLDRRRRRAARRARRARRPRAQRAGARPRTSSAPRPGSASPSACRASSAASSRRGDALVDAGCVPTSAIGSTSRSSRSGEIPARGDACTTGRRRSRRGSCRAGERYAQLRLAAPVVAARGDRVVLRDRARPSAADVVLDPAPPRHVDAERLAVAAAVTRGARPRARPPTRSSSAASRPTRSRRADGWVFAPEWLDELAGELERRLDDADPLDPGVPPPSDAVGATRSSRCSGSSGAARSSTGRERRRARRRRGGGVSSRPSSSSPARARQGRTTARSPRFLEREGRLVRVGDGYAIGRARVRRRARRARRECEQARAGSRSPASATSLGVLAAAGAAPPRAVRRRRPHAPRRRRARAAARGYVLSSNASRSGRW